MELSRFKTPSKREHENNLSLFNRTPRILSSINRYDSGSAMG